ncbi:integral membrane protein [Nocardia amikacinitolerans]|uniref:Integral membrane protein n=1 Tax=Nocardia amikacinitolerans TaxID=756689 RepID=A0A285LC13_9NOCA|nr:integral membrane protein [Nocardia amikacinitolerans]MCP2293227.1 integral membrane protein [Nocardia amikacinitolerans]MCP2299995.1 integral membrane protein [Nocardia amikacinitolerans]MCP2320777.1 integral membrane protein [Nocardia amikacinitolerans]SNY81557.1 integral membrane protein [Nocardia amikacinitolerans]
MSASENETTVATEPKAAPAQAANTAKIASALLRYRVLAWTTGLWLLLLTGEMIAKYGFDANPPSWIAVVHGWVYFIYLIATADLAVKVRWPLGRTIGTLIAGTVPLLSFFVEHTNAKQVKTDFGV